MNKELNKILEFKENADYKRLSCDEIIFLQEYIINLQNSFKSTVEELCETTEKFEKLQEKYEKMKENAEILSKGYSDLEKRNEKAIDNIDIVIELIKQQPTEDDTWILNRLNGFKYILQGSDEE